MIRNGYTLEWGIFMEIDWREYRLTQFDKVFSYQMESILKFKGYMMFCAL